MAFAVTVIAGLTAVAFAVTGVQDTPSLLACLSPATVARPSRC